MQTKDDRSLGTLFADLTQETSDLVRKEVELAKAEVSEKVSQLGSGVASLAIGGAVAYAGLLVLLAAVVIGLDQILRSYWDAPWLSPLIVGIVVAVIGLVMLQSGRNHMKAQNLAPRRTIQSLKRDTEFAKEHVR